MSYPVTDVPSAAWSWILGHLPPPEDVELHILCPVFGMRTQEAHFEYGGAKWHCFQRKKFEPLFLRFRFYLRIRRFVKTLNPDVVHGWGGESGCGLLATYCSTHAVVSIQGLLRMLCANARRWGIKIPECGSVSSWFRRVLEVWTYRRAHRLLVESETAAENLRTLYGLGSEVVPQPLREAFINHEIHEGHENGSVFLFVGQMTARKGAIDALTAYSELDDKTARLVMVGCGDQDSEIDNFIARQGIGNRVCRIKSCSADELRSLMVEASAIVVPSYGDTGPTVLKEALSQGLYAICYDNTGAAELVKKYPFGTLCQTGDRQALTEEMSRVCRRIVAKNADVAIRVKKDLSRERVWGMLKDFYG